MLTASLLKLSTKVKEEKIQIANFQKYKASTNSSVFTKLAAAAASSLLDVLVVVVVLKRQGVDAHVLSLGLAGDEVVRGGPQRSVLPAPLLQILLRPVHIFFLILLLVLLLNRLAVVLEFFVFVLPRVLVRVGIALGGVLLPEFIRSLRLVLLCGLGGDLS